MTRDPVSLPLIAVGAAGAFALTTWLRPRRADAATAAPTASPPAAAPASAIVRALPFHLARPVAGDVHAIVSSGWLADRHGRQHRALDIPVSVGTPILAIDDGIVTRAVTVDHGDAGRWVAILHPSRLTSRYLHLSRVLVEVGQLVQRGDRIALSGNTGNSAGPHLHLDLRAPAAILPIIEQAIGRPRSGWGPEMTPFGHSIPGEPFVPTDGYRDHVRTDAAREGIALHAPSAHRNRSTGFVYRPVGSPGERYPEWLHRLKGSSGVYLIRERDRDGDPVIVYVGASSTGRLFETLTRHLQTWRRWKGYWRGQYGEGHDPGLTYPRERVEVAVRVTPHARALDEEALLIRRLRPRDNLIGQPDAEREAVPF